MFGMMMDTGPKFYTVPSPAPYMTLRSRSQTFMIKFYIKVFRTSLFPNPMMDLVHFGTMIDTGLKFYAVPSTPPVHDLKVKITDLELLCKSFT